MMDDSVQNPYIVGGAIHNDQDFYDRSSIVKQLLTNDSRGHYLKGNRRIGKTNLLNYLQRNINQGEDKRLAILYNLEGAETEKEFAQYLVRAIKRATALKRISPPDFSTQELIPMLETLIHWLEEVDYTCFLLIDEAEALLGLPDKTRASLHNRLINNSDKLTVLLAATNHLQKLYSNNNGDAPFLDGFVTHYIGCFDDSSAEALIRQSQLPEEQRPQVDDVLVKEIIHYCGNHPLYIQRLCSELFENGGLRPIRDSDLLLDRAIRGFIDVDFQHLSQEEQKTLLHFYWEKSLAITDLPIDCRAHVRELRQLGFLKTDGQLFSISNIFLHQWLENHRSQQQSQSNAVAAIGSQPAHQRKIFISYSKADKDWREKLKAQLSTYVRNGLIEIWDDSMILPGSQWEEEITKKLNATDVFLFLVSADLLNTDYIMEIELPIAIRRSHTNQAVLIPIIMRDCPWTDTALGAFQALPEKGKPVSSFENRDEPLAQVVRKIAELAKLAHE